MNTSFMLNVTHTHTHAHTHTHTHTHTRARAGVQASTQVSTHNSTYNPPNFSRQNRAATPTEKYQSSMGRQIQQLRFTTILAITRQ